MTWRPIVSPGTSEERDALVAAVGKTKLDQNVCQRQINLQLSRRLRHAPQDVVEKGELEDVGQGSLRISLASLERRQAVAAPVGQPLSHTSAWAILALASGDAAFRAHVAARLSDPERSRAKTRLMQHGLLDLLPRLRGRATPPRGFVVGAEPLVEFLADGPRRARRQQRRASARLAAFG